MILRITGSEMADWMELWCFRCDHDHGFSHSDEEDPDQGCQLLLGYVTQTEVPEWEARDVDPLRFIPAEVSCSKFKVCERCGPESSDKERRGGETLREFRDRLRNETLARPVVIPA